jgi:hypothetical protein
METSTTIRKMMHGNKIVVPSYQRAYSWETPVVGSTKRTHTDIFLTDLEEYKKSGAKSPYYFGHFLFEEKQEMFCVIDGQQRLTTIVIFLAALFAKLRALRSLSEEEGEAYEDMVRRHSTVRFSTVHYDNQLFKDYVIEQTKADNNGIETESARRIVGAFDFFKKKLTDTTEEYLTTMLIIVSSATCTTHRVQNESEAIQMFIFQNDRGKRPSHLEIIKAQFMYNVHLHGHQDKDALIEEIKNRFEKIYRSIASIEYRIDEDDVLLYTLRVHFNSLWEADALDKIKRELSGSHPIGFIKTFTHSLSISFEHLSTFFGKHERQNMAIHSLVTLGGIAIAIPFVIKAYKFGLEIDDLGRLCGFLESVVLRDRLIGTRADLTSRLNDVFQKFTQDNSDIRPIADLIDHLKIATDLWSAYWNNGAFAMSLQGGMDHALGKYLLWKYENHLEKQGNDGYVPTRYDRIISPELEHIAPTAEPLVRPHGYCDYDEEFVRQYLNCLGNYLLLSKSHNCSVGRVPFREKRETYIHNEQQREIQRLVPENGIWSKEIINNRKTKIIAFIMETF